MAASVSKKQEIDFGNVRGAIFEITMTGVTEYDFTENDHGFRNILHVDFNNETSEADGLVQKNTLAAGATIGGIYLSGFTAADVVSIFVIGN